VAPEPEGSSRHSQQPANDPYPKPGESTHPQLISLRSLLTPSSHLRLGLSSGLFPSGFPTKTLYTFLPTPMHATCPTYLHFSVPRSFCQRILPGPRLCDTFCNRLDFLRCWVVSYPPNPQAGGPPPVGCPRLLIQYIRSYPPYLEAVSSIHNLRTRHAVVTGDPLNTELQV
jgi:hypothetical protein